MRIYQVWDSKGGIRFSLFIVAESSFDARKEYAARMGIDYLECAARWRDDLQPAKV